MITFSDSWQYKLHRIITLNRSHMSHWIVRMNGDFKSSDTSNLHSNCFILQIISHAETIAM